MLTRKLSNKDRDAEGGIPGTYKATVGHAVNLSAPRGNRPSGLCEETTKSKEEVSESSKSTEKIELYQALIPMRRRRPAQTMTIEKIQIALRTAIESHRVSRIVDMIGNNFELVDNAVNSKDTVTTELLKKAIDLISKDDGSTIFHLIAHKEDKVKILNLFLELDSVKVIESIGTVKNGKRKTAYEIAKEKRGSKKFLEVVDNTRNQKNELSSSAKSNSTEMRYSTSSDLSAGDSPSIPVKNDDRTYEEHYFNPLQLAVNNKNIDNIVVIMTALIRDIEIAKDQINKQLHTDNLHKAIKVTDSEGNTAFHILASYKNFGDKEVKILELLRNLEGIMPSAMEVQNKAGETPPDVAEKSGNKKLKKLYNPLTKENLNLQKITLEKPPTLLASTNSSLNLTPDSIEINDTQTEPKIPPKPAPRQSKQPTLNPELTSPSLDSDTDSGLGSSPGSSPKDSLEGKEGVESLTNSRRSSLYQVQKV